MKGWTGFQMNCPRNNAVSHSFYLCICWEFLFSFLFRRDMSCCCSPETVLHIDHKKQNGVAPRITPSFVLLPAGTRERCYQVFQRIYVLFSFLFPIAVNSFMFNLLRSKGHLLNILLNSNKLCLSKSVLFQLQTKSGLSKLNILLLFALFNFFPCT